jgi:hypothetical protein
MGFSTGPEPAGVGIDGATTFRRSSMSNFAAMSGPNSGRLSPEDQITSKIIDVFSNTNYAFWDVSVGFRILFFLRFLDLRGIISPGRFVQADQDGGLPVFLASFAAFLRDLGGQNLLNVGSRKAVEKQSQS